MLLLYGVLLTASATAQEGCPTNIDCENAIYICDDHTESFNCLACELNDDRNLWHVFTVESAGQVLNVNAGSYSIEEIAVYGPFNADAACDNLDNPISPTSLTSNLAEFSFQAPGVYYIHLKYLRCNEDNSSIIYDFSPNKICSQDPVAVDECEGCVGSFNVLPNKKYVISAWTKEDISFPNDKISFTAPEIHVEFSLQGGGTQTEGPFLASGEIIDEWQKIEAEFDVPANAEGISIILRSNSGDVLFDDLRIFPFDASVKTYVYDPVFMRLAAELDERHYATFYEYDEEGKLIRIKKETERGIMTIQETRNNNAK